ncbi:MAG: hypothetical protein ABFD81_01920 [Syntrophaceae bacterium]
MINQQWIQENIDVLVEEVLSQIARDSILKHYRTRLRQNEVRERIRAVFQDGFERLQAWLQSDKQDEEILRPYIELGRERRREGVPLEEVIRVFLMVNRTINVQIEANKLFNSRYRLNELADLNRDTATFFSKIVHALIMGYEEGV